MIDLILIVIDVVCLIAFVIFIHCEKENTKARKEQTKQLEKENELLGEIIRMWNKLDRSATDED